MYNKYGVNEEGGAGRLLRAAARRPAGEDHHQKSENEMRQLQRKGEFEFQLAFDAGTGRGDRQRGRPRAVPSAGDESFAGLLPNDFFCDNAQPLLERFKASRAAERHPQIFIFYILIA